MERTSSISQFEKAIKDFSKISIEIDSLINKENAEAIRIKNKSIENRKEAISNEASRRIVSFEQDQKQNKTKTSSNIHDTLEERILKEVEVEFDNGVTEEKLLLRGSSEEHNGVIEKTSEADKEEEDAESDESGSEESTDDESSENESTGEGSTNEESTEDENTDHTSEESTSEESTDDETSDKDNSDDKNIENVRSDEENVDDAAGKVDDSTKNK